MHALSLGTWFIHIATVLEWITAIILINKISIATKNIKINLLAIAMLPNLASAMTAIAWHIFDNTQELKGLVVIQATLTVLGNSTMALAAFNIFKTQSVEL
tara:strand:+ start:3072 stop:3374 length:303 start_codon:yes stop_codon:yes gene_type:complete